MTRLFLIRHGEPEAAWGVADDPGLSAAGRTQAEAAAGALAPDLAILSSPMRRCQETAAPFEARLGARARIEPRVSEVATPGDIPDRRAWLGETFPWRDGAPGRDWATLDAALHRWRADALDAVLAINAIVGAALGRNETIVCRPNYASITQLSVEHGVLRLVALGAAMSEGDVR
jgi:broad specificity phosphatase PhoE